ncbi:LpxI family protein [Pseudaestuariivita sp.]|uniref:LpxI family protein n=1 Tax=Pseudaestuariivita sp. TaxID=2211669 RepID=UPI004059859E
MAGALAILAGRGALPGLLHAAAPDAVCFAVDPDHGLAVDLPHVDLHQLGAFFEDLRARGVTRVVMAGGVAPPRFDPTRLDTLMQGEAAKLLAAFQAGDDAVLRAVIDLFERQGFTVVGAHDVAPALIAREGTVGPLTAEAAADITRGRHILGTLGPLDIGQACVVAGGRCLGVETAQGTDALLGFVATHRGALTERSGVLIKAPKPGQDLRVDMPAIGPDTVRRAAKAGLAGIAVAADGVLVLNRVEVEAALAETGLFVTGFAP